jgi:hypothetical protein
LSSKYEIKLRKPQASIDLNLPSLVEEHPEFRVETRKRKEKKALLKEVRESNIRLYWHNVVLTTKLKHRDTRASAIIIP